MSQRGIHFANDWISDTIDLMANATEHRPPLMCDEWARQLTAAASIEGITREEIEEGVGDLAQYIADCLEEASDSQDDRNLCRSPGNGASRH